ncbi:MAG: hypothetical protein AAF368_11240 [Planctomycetota bacterium]
MLPGGQNVRVRLGDGRVSPGAGNSLVALELANDFRGFFSTIPQGDLGLIFTDGFESGNVSRWSSSTP